MSLPPFHNPTLLAQALTHRSAVNEGKSSEHNERLEYLGDAVLELTVSEKLYRSYPKKTEGELTALRAALVRTETLAELAQELGIPSQLRMSRGEHRAGGQHNPSLLANTMEAVIGALYLDQGLTVVRQFLEETLLKNVEATAQKALLLDTKSKYQEVVQAQGYPSPVYRITHTEGPDHSRTFTAEVIVSTQVAGTGAGRSKQEAEEAAARAALETWR